MGAEVTLPGYDERERLFSQKFCEMTDMLEWNFTVSSADLKQSPTDMSVYVDYSWPASNGLHLLLGGFKTSLNVSHSP